MALLVACSPVLDWREVRAPDSAARLLMPCKPSVQERRVPLAGRPTRLVLLACAAGDITWGLAVADVGSPARVGEALQALALSAGGNVAAAAPTQRLPLVVPGGTPHAAAQMLRFEGRLPDGKAVRMQTAVFSHGTWVYQASALGPALPDEPVQTFMASIRLVN